MPCTPAAASVGWFPCASAASMQPQSPSGWRECFNGFFTKKLITTLDSGSGIVMMLAGALPRVADHFLTTRKIDMTINKALLALAMGCALAACSNQQQADDSAADAADAAAAAQTAADEAAAAGSMTADVAQDAADTEIGRAHV